MSPAELRTLFLFEALDDEQLAWLSERGRVERRDGGTAVYKEGEPATCFFVLLSGAITLNRRLHGDDIEVTRTDQRGVYSGAMQAYLGDRVDQVYGNTMRAVSDVELFVLSADDFTTAIRTWFPMALHLLEGLFFGSRAANMIVGERERLVALGSLSAGLTHELNNPAAAAVRATEALRERVAGMRHKLAMIADGRLDGSRLRGLVE
ncbi:cyclic nucleotide-binding domain-containing protein, partial [Streptomyces sp. SID3212]